MRASLILFMVIAAGSANAQTEVCEAAQKFVRDTNRNLPKKVDKITTLVQIKANCASKIITFIRTLDVSFDSFHDDWKSRKKIEHQQLHCNKNGLARVSRWTVVDTMMDKNLDFYHIQTDPAECVD